MRINRIGILNISQVSKESILSSLQFNGLECFVTDAARILGATYKTENGFGDYWLESDFEYSKKKNPSAKFVDKEGKISDFNIRFNQNSVRIAINFDDISDFDLDNLDNLRCEMPMFVIGGIFGETLEKLFAKKSRLVKKTGRVHEISNQEYDEYEAFNLKFIKMKSDSASKTLSDGTKLEKDKYAFIRVQNIPLIPDEDARILYSSVTLFPMKVGDSCDSFKSSELMKYLNGKFLESINDELPHKESSIENTEEIESNRYNFDFNPMNEEEIMESCIYCNIAVFVHGKTGVGKTERMLVLDSNLELVDFGCTSADGFTGIVAKDFNSKELFLYEPFWYKNLCKKCEKEPELLHILFLEELPNAKNDIQKVAFEVTLNKTLTNSGFRLKLPSNAVVCAAGNEANESKSANAMSEPLFSRFAHIYIDVDSDKWVEWASQRKKTGKKLLFNPNQIFPEAIHPAIIDFIRIKGDSALRTPYNGIKPNVDPRKWAMSSKLLYYTNNPNVLRAFIGEELTQEFIMFCKMNIITISDVLSGKVISSEVSTDSSIRWQTTMCLSTVDDENVEAIRSFVKDLGNEFLALFDYEWSKDNEQRIMKLFKENYNTPFARRLEQNGNQ